ncbi:MAG: carboxylesterase family protein [Deltaproteobacteria bacterium]|nr:carboxylesterase family protein [Deltaproteobacteria bacterium]
MTRSLIVALLIGVVACSDADESQGVTDAGADGGGQDDGASPMVDASGNSCSLPPAAPGVVFIDTGAVRGKAAAADSAVTAFLGIPYAAPPTGERRFRPPAAAACWSGVREATDFGPICPQRPVEQGKPGDPNAALQGNEDCLTLNVWTRLQSTTAPKPVMLFIHGGGNMQGAGSEPFYDGTALSEKGGVVVVTFNYRLGALGFLSHPALSAERDEKVSGNYGVLDQLAVLKWVKRNIAAFGGDPNRVLVFGESAGGVNTCTLVASPLAAGLFHRALVQSGGCVGNASLAEGEAEGLALGSKAGCTTSDVAACLRAKTAQEIIDAGPKNLSLGLKQGAGEYGSVVDGFVLKEVPLAAIRSGRHNKVPIVFGANADETNLMIGAGPKTALEYVAWLGDLFGPTLAARVLKQYPVSRFTSPREAAVAVTSDYRFICPSVFYADAAVIGGSPTVFHYLFSKARDVSPAAALLGAYHGVEIAYLFQTLKMATPTESSLANAMLGYWSRFAATGDPNGGEAPLWPGYGAGVKKSLRLDSPIVVADGVRTDDCAFWLSTL